MSDMIVCDFVFVPNGAPFPTDWVRRHPDYITLPARFTGSPAFMQRMFGKRRAQDRYKFSKSAGIVGGNQEPGTMGVRQSELSLSRAQSAKSSSVSQVLPVSSRSGDFMIRDRWTGLTKDQLLGPGLAYLERDPSSLTAFLSASGSNDIMDSPVDTHPGVKASAVPSGSAATAATEFQAQTVNYMSKETRTSHTAVPFLDDDGKQVLKRDGMPMMRSGDVDPHFFIDAGRTAVQMDLETNLLGVGAPVQGMTG